MSITAAYIGVILIWSTTPLAIKWSGEDVGFLFGVTARMIIGALICLLILAFMRIPLQWHKKAVLTYLSASIAIYGTMLCVYWSAQFISSGMISVLFGMTPLMTGIFAALILKERSLDMYKFTGILLGIGGLVAIFYSDIASSSQATTGIAVALIATTIHSLSTVLVKSLDCKLHGIVVNTGGLLISSVLFLLTWFISGATMPEMLPLKAGMSILYLGVIGNVVGFTLFFYALKNMDAGKIGLIPMITPVLALMLGYLFNNEALGWKLILGSVLILSGLFLHHWEYLRTMLLEKYKTSMHQYEN